MYEETKDIILDIVKEITEIDHINIDLEEDLDNIGIESMHFIRMIVAIENKFDIEVDDENLDYNQFKSLKNLITYIETIVCQNI